MISETGITENNNDDAYIHNPSNQRVESSYFQTVESRPVKPFNNDHDSDKDDYFIRKMRRYRENCCAEYVFDIQDSLRNGTGPEENPRKTGKKKGTEDLKNLFQRR